MYCDTHTHVNLISENPEDWSVYIENALAHDVHFMMNVGVDTETIKESSVLAKQYKEIFYAAGYHPSVLKEGQIVDLDFLKQQCSDSKLLAIGEIGLDYYYYQDNKKEQRNLFEKQIALAIEHNLPIVIHSRDAWEDTFAVLNNFNSSLRGVFHCFSGDYNIGKRCLEYDFMISFSGNVTFKKAIDLQEAAFKLPLDKIFFETDAPYLTPVPKRGQTNEPANVELVYQFVSNLREIEMQKLSKQIQENIMRFFNLEEL